MPSFPNGGFGVEVELYNLRVKKNAPANFAKWHGAVPLLVAQPAEAGAAGFIEKDFEKFGGVHIACRQLALNLGLRCRCIHVIIGVQSTVLTALRCTSDDEAIPGLLNYLRI